jgi:ribosomal protein S18 acetylase RimI-like enzyme
MIGYRDAVPADGVELAQVARRSFTETFGTLYRQSDLADFLERAFGADGLPSQLDDPDFAVRLALDGDRIVGFAKIGPNALPEPAPAGAVELYQLYILSQWHGTGVAAMLMDWVLAVARARGASHLVLTVFVDNIRAQRFYARYGLVEIGKYPFPVGEQIDDDRIMSVAL